MHEHPPRVAIHHDESAIDGVLPVADERGLRTALEETHAHLTRKIVALAAAEGRIADLQASLHRAEHDLALARATIRNMEGSIFWRARRIWAAVSRVLGRPT